MSLTRRPKWHPTLPPPPSPKILNLPRRTRRHKKATRAAASDQWRSNKGLLVTLFDEEEREFSSSVPIVLLNSKQRRRERVEEESGAGAVAGGGGIVEEKWRFQAEILRAECNFLRMERELALKKLERNRAQMERTLRSAVHTLVSGRKKTYHGKNVSVVLEEEIEDLAEKLLELQRSYGVGDFEIRKCNNFDKKACLLQQMLEKLGGLSNEKCLKEIRVVAESISRIEHESLSSDCKSKNTPNNEGILERMEEELGLMISTTATPYSSVASSASNSNSKGIEFPDSSSFSIRQPEQEVISVEEKKCSGRCKAIVRRVVEQVRAETEQWSQMQEMLGQVRDEMEELQSSRDYWEDRALHSDSQVRSLLSSVEEWKQRALTFETRANELETQVSLIKKELQSLRTEQKRETATKSGDSSPLSLGKQLEKEKRVLNCHIKENGHTCADNEGAERDNLMMEKCNEIMASRGLQVVSLGKQMAKEKRGLIGRFKENRQNRSGNNEGFSDGKGKENGRKNVVETLWRSPLRSIGNSSPLVK